MFHTEKRHRNFGRSKKAACLWHRPDHGLQQQSSEQGHCLTLPPLLKCVAHIHQQSNVQLSSAGNNISHTAGVKFDLSSIQKVYDVTDDFKWILREVHFCNLLQSAVLLDSEQGVMLGYKMPKLSAAPSAASVTTSHIT